MNFTGTMPYATTHFFVQRCSLAEPKKNVLKVPRHQSAGSTLGPPLREPRGRYVQAIMIKILKIKLKA